MFGKKSCYLCGGKLVNGRCVECGLDNERNAKKKYRLNESSRDRKARIRYEESRTGNAGDENIRRERVQSQAAQSGRKKTADDTKHTSGKYVSGKSSGVNTGIPVHQIREQADRAARQISAPVKSAWNTGKANVRGTAGGASSWNRGTAGSTGSGGRRAVVFVVVVIVVVIVVSGISGMISNMSSDEGWTWNDLDWGDDGGDYEYDPYEYVDAQLSDTGETYDIDLTSGEYVVGVHLPEGNYSASLTQGTGYINVTDDENGIYLYQSFGYEEEYDEVTEMDDIRLFDGAIVEFSGDGILSLHTDTAQTQDMSWEENPLTASVHLSAGRSYVAGEDFPEGVYDITASEWTTVEYKLYLGDIYDDEELNYWQNSLWFSGDDAEDVYHNIVLPAGTEISSDTAAATLVPSPVIGSTDYDSYYDRYR